MTLDDIRTAARMLLQGASLKAVCTALNLPETTLDQHANAILFEIALRNAGIVNIKPVEQVA